MEGFLHWSQCPGRSFSPTPVESTTTRPLLGWAFKLEDIGNGLNRRGIGSARFTCSWMNTSLIFNTFIMERTGYVFSCTATLRSLDDINLMMILQWCLIHDLYTTYVLCSEEYHFYGTFDHSQYLLLFIFILIQNLYVRHYKKHNLHKMLLIFFLYSKLKAQIRNFSKYILSYNPKRPWYPLTIKTEQAFLLDSDYS